MKYVALPVGLIFFVVAGLLGRKRPRIREGLVFLLAFMLFIDLSDYDLNFLSNENYRGTDRGIEITIIDLIVVGILASLKEKSPFPLPYRLAFLAYLVPCAFSVLLASRPELSMFPVLKLLRMYLCVYVVARACEDRRVPPVLLMGFATGIIWEAAYCLKLRYVDHHHQVEGSFSHQNSLGMAINLWAPIMMALLLRQRGKLAAGATLGGVICVILTLSRGAMALFVLGAVATFSASVIFRRLTRRKLWIAMGGVAAATAVLMKSLDTIIRRFEQAPEGSAAAREHFNEAAKLMALDHPFGVGMNMYSHELQSHYAERVGIDPEGYGASAIAHHVYYLTMAEAGFLGLLGYVVLIAWPLVLAVRTARAMRGSVRSDVLIGCAIGLSCFYTAGFLEWAARQTVLSYMFFIMAGLVLGLRRQWLRPLDRGDDDADAETAPAGH